MSTLNVANISDGTDTVETGYVVNGSAKAHAYISLTFVVQSGSLNISNEIDNGAGNLSVDLTAAMANATYTVQANSANSLTMAVSYPVSESQYSMRMFNTSGTYSDRATMSSIHGDLA